MAIILKNAPKTEEGRRLNLTKEQEEQYRIVFRFDKDTKKLANVEPWSAEGKYDNHCIIASLSSTYYNIVKFPNQYGFRNVVGSSIDPNPYGGSWLGVIRLVYDVLQIPCRTDICCLDPYHYDAAGNQTPVPNHGNSNIIGGHMVEWNMDPVYGDLQYLKAYYYPIGTKDDTIIEELKRRKGHLNNDELNKTALEQLDYILG